MKIIAFTTEYLSERCVTDNPTPRFSYAIQSDRQGAKLQQAELTIGNWTKTTSEQISVPYDGEKILPFTQYQVSLPQRTTTARRTRLR